MNHLVLLLVALAIGNEAVLSSAGIREAHCGRRLVSGLFTRPRLPLGYSRVATVPRGACRLNVSEIMASENYIALKMTNGSYIFNGEFAVSNPGLYDAAGTRFQYNRVGGADQVFAHGPLQNSIDIMILYTQPNPSIKYEYLTDSDEAGTSNDISPPNSATPHQSAQRHHRHHPSEPHTKSLDQSLVETKYNAYESQSQINSNVVGNRKFIWKILTFTTCSRTCGGGLQIGKFKCVEVDGKEDREVSPAHCTGAPPPTKRRRCGTALCPPRWRAAPWGPCPVCGPAQRTRIVGCVQDHARGITKISDQKCTLPMPANTEACDIPNCDGTSVTTEAPRPDSRRQVRTRDRTEHFRDSPVVTLATNTSDLANRRSSKQDYSFSAGGGWLYTDWSECVGWCVGGGVQSRGVRCAEPAGCAPRAAPLATRSCARRQPCDPHEGEWFMSEWSKCSARCGGQQTRGVLCVGGAGRRLREAACRAPRPAATRACGGLCAPDWYLSDWGECHGPCESGVQSRAVWCAAGDLGADGSAGAGGEAGPGAGAAVGGALRDSACAGTRPPSRRTCVPARCTTRPTVRPPASLAGPTVSEPQQRVTRHQSRDASNDIKERSFTDGSKVCEDKKGNCMLAVQARLCHYPYYAEYCCSSCRGK